MLLIKKIVVLSFFKPIFKMNETLLKETKIHTCTDEDLDLGKHILANSVLVLKKSFKELAYVYYDKCF